MRTSTPHATPEISSALDVYSVLVFSIPTNRNLILKPSSGLYCLFVALPSVVLMRTKLATFDSLRPLHEHQSGRSNINDGPSLYKDAANMESLQSWSQPKRRCIPPPPHPHADRGQIMSPPRRCVNLSRCKTPCLGAKRH